MGSGADNALVALLLEIKDEIDAAGRERSHVLAVLESSRITDLDRAFASLRRAEDSERDTRLYYRERLAELGKDHRRTLWLAGAGAAPVSYTHLRAHETLS